MTISMTLCKQPLVSPLLDFSTAKIGPNILTLNRHRPKDKVVIIMGPTGTGKSRLSIDLATCFPAEIINSDKMQVHEGLDIVTNKITADESAGVPHHLLGVLPPTADFTVTSFCHMANLSVESVLSRGKLPIIVGGSNSYIEALVDDCDYDFRSKYDCCFLWVDVSMPVLHSFVAERVDKMVENGMVGEVRQIFDFSDSDYTKGIRKAIGVPEFDWFFRIEPFLCKRDRQELLWEVVEEIKKNTRALACRQRGKIERLRRVKRWNIHRLDATPVFRQRWRKVDTDAAWETLVAAPSANLVSRFLLDVAGRRTLGGNNSGAVAAAAAREREEMAQCLIA